MSNQVNTVAPSGVWNSQAIPSEDIQTLRETIAQDCNDSQFRLFLATCNRTGLDPIARQIHPVIRQTSKQVNGQWTKVPVLTIQVGIDGFRVIAQRSRKYRGQTAPQWCGDDGIWMDVWLKPTHPAAARVGILHEDFTDPIWGVATYKSYAQTDSNGKPIGLWGKMPDNQLLKCFDEETEVLTTNGFEPFKKVTGSIIQVTPSGGLLPSDSIPFAQLYDGPMVTVDNDMLNFCVSPNHDMVTTVGKVEAGAMLATANFKGNWSIPMRVPACEATGMQVPDDDLRLAGYILADGTSISGSTFAISVSRPHKVKVLATLGHTGHHVRHAKGNIAEAATRKIITNFDKQVFSFSKGRVDWLVRDDKVVNCSALLTLSSRQAKIVLDAWQEFDGSTNKKTGVRRIYTSRKDHAAAIELLAVRAGYSVSSRKERASDISSKPGFYLTISSVSEVKVNKPLPRRDGIKVTSNPTGRVWCCKVPSGVIVVRRHGFSMLCGNCAEAQGLRKAFPNDLSGIYEPAEGASEPIDITPSGQPTTHVHSSATPGDTVDPGLIALRQRLSQAFADAGAPSEDAEALGAKWEADIAAGRASKAGFLTMVERAEAKAAKIQQDRAASAAATPAEPEPAKDDDAAAIEWNWTAIQKEILSRCRTKKQAADTIAKMQEAWGQDGTEALLQAQAKWLELPQWPWEPEVKE